jgi:hypothetical protein
MTDFTVHALERLLVAMLVGFLVGLDRERAETRREHALARSAARWARRSG